MPSAIEADMWCFLSSWLLSLWLWMTSFPPVFLRRHARGMLEILAEEADVWKVKGVCYFSHLFAAVFQHDLRIGHNGAVNPFFCRYPACLFDGCAEVTGRDTHLVRIKSQFPLTPCVSVHEADECVEKLKQETRRYAKRQITWFKRDKDINWLCVDEYDSFEELYKDACQIIEKENIDG